MKNPILKRYYIIETHVFSIPYPELFKKPVDTNIHFLNKISYKNQTPIDGFFPLGRSISLHWLRRNPFAVIQYSFMNQFLAAAAILTCK